MMMKMLHCFNPNPVVSAQSRVPSIYPEVVSLTTLDYDGLNRCRHDVVTVGGYHVEQMTVDGHPERIRHGRGNEPKAVLSASPNFKRLQRDHCFWGVRAVLVPPTCKRGSFVMVSTVFDSMKFQQQI